MATYVTVSVSGYDGSVSVEAVAAAPTKQERRQSVVLTQGNVRFEMLCQTAEQIERLARSLLESARELRGGTPTAGESDDVVDAQPAINTLMQHRSGLRGRIAEDCRFSGGLCIVQQNGNTCVYEPDAWKPVS